MTERSNEKEFLLNKKLSKICSLGVGGEAEFFAEPETPEMLQKIFIYARQNDIPVYTIGGGSNVLFPDGLIKGIVISTRKLNSIEWLSGFRAKIQAGYILPKLVKELSNHNLGGLEFATGIPGTLGGAIHGNAGTSGKGICDFIDEINTLESNGDFKTWLKNDFKYSYRYCELADDERIIISCVMSFREAKSNDLQEINNFAAKRKNQPIGFKNAGCTFKNPVEQTSKSAGQLLDESGCKGLRIGCAVVSEKHANFILNISDDNNNENISKSSDVIELIKICRKRVFEQTGITLEPEIKFVGFEPPLLL